MLFQERTTRYCSSKCKSEVASLKKSELDYLWVDERLSFIHNLRILYELVGEQPLFEEKALPVSILNSRKFNFEGLVITSKFEKKMGIWLRIGPYAVQQPNENLNITIFKFR